jgi:hypothetical protein
VPENRAQYSATVKWITRKEVEKSKQKVAGSYQKEHHHRSHVISRGRDAGAGEREDPEKKTCRRPSHGDA